MIRYKIILLSMVIISFCASISGQNIKKLSIGDTVPEISFKHVINYPETHFTLSDFKGKLVILDFFGTWCGSCVPVVPKLDSLQKQFKGKLQVIVICQDVSIEKVKTFIARQWRDNNISLPFVLDDSLYNSLFPHTMIPHEIWILPNGTLKAFTDDEVVTSKNIDIVLNNELVDLPLKIDQVRFNRNEPLLDNGNGGNNANILFRSLFTGNLNGIPGGAGFIRDTIHRTIRYYFLDRSIPSLYELATNINQDKLVLDINDSSHFFYNPHLNLTASEWYQKNAYCYELTVPDTTSNSLVKQIIIDDLNKYLGLYGRISKKKIDGWALIESAKKRDNSIPEKKKGKMYRIQNRTPSEIAQILSSPTNTIVNSISIHDRISFSLTYAALDNIQILKKELQYLGLDLIPTKCDIDQLIITENYKNK